MIIFRHLPLSFVDLDEYARLIISVSSESLRLLCWDSRITGDKNSHDASSSFDTLRKWCNVKNNHILDIAAIFVVKDSSLDSSTICNSLIRVD